MTWRDTTRHSFPPDFLHLVFRHLPLRRLYSSWSFLLPIPSLFHAPLVPRVLDATRPAASLRHVFTHHLSSLSFSPCVTLCHAHCGTRSPFLFPFCLSRCHPASLMVTLHPNAASGLVCSTAGSGAPSCCFPSHCLSRCTAGTSIRQQVRASHMAARFKHRPSASVAPRASSR